MYVPQYVYDPEPEPDRTRTGPGTVFRLNVGTGTENGAGTVFKFSGTATLVKGLLESLQSSWYDRTYSKLL